MRWRAFNETLQRINTAVVCWEERGKGFLLQSRILAFLSDPTPAERCFSESRIGQFLRPSTSHTCRSFRWRIGFLRWKEQALWCRLWRQGRDRLLSSTVGSFGTWWLLLGLFSLLFQWILRPLSPASLSFLLPLFMVASAVPLLHSRRSLSRALTESRILSSCLGREASDARFGWFSVGVDRRWSALLLAIAGAVISAVTSPALFLLGLAALLFLSWVAASPEGLFCFLLFVFPFLPLTGHTTLALSLLLLLGMLAFAWKVAGGQREVLIGVPEIFMLLMTFQYLLGSISDGGEGAVRGFLLLGGLPYAGLLSTPRHRRRGVRALVLGGGITGAWGVAEYLLGKAVLGWVDLDRFGGIGGRVCASFSNPNIFAVYLLLVLPLALQGILEETRRGWRLLSGGAFLLVLASLFLTWSRGAWLGAMLSILTFLLFYSPGTRRGSLVLLLLLPSVAGILPQVVKMRFLSIGNPVDSSATYRLYTWRGVGRMLSEHPFGIGCGESVFRRVYSTYAVSGTERVMHAHSLLLGVWCEIGIVGVGLLVLWLFFSMQCALGSVRARDGLSGIRLGAVASILGCLVMGFFDWIWYQPGMLFLFSAVVSLGREGARARDWEVTYG